ncbi:unnamed protein product [Chrysoparadoxa australica]
MFRPGSDYVPSLLKPATRPRMVRASAAVLMAFIDIGANLTDGMFQGLYHGKQKHDPDLHQVLDRAWEHGLEKVIITAGSLEDAHDSLQLARSHPALYTTVGVHPTRAGALSGDQGAAQLAGLREVIKDGKGDGKVVALGELGLDYDRLHFCSKEDQLSGFEVQFSLAEESGLPLFLHSRACQQDFHDIVSRNRGRFSEGVVHSFTGTADEAAELIDLGLYIGINGCSLKTAENLDVLSTIPVERLMMETDAPWCEIRPSHAGSDHIKTKFPSLKKEKWVSGSCVKGRQEPCHIVQVLEVMAAVLGSETGELAQVLLENTKRVFFP